MITATQASRSPTSFKDLLRTLDLKSELSAQKSAELMDAVKALSEEDLSTLCAQDLTKLGIPRPQHAAIVYFALARKHPDLVPHMIANTLAEGLTRLSQSRHPKVEETLQRFAEKFQLDPQQEPFTSAELSWVDVRGLKPGATEDRVAVRFLLEKRPSGGQGTLDLWSVGTGEDQNKRWRVELNSTQHNFAEGTGGMRSLETLSPEDLERIQQVLERHLPPSDSSPVVRQAAMENLEMKALASFHRRVTNLLAEKRAAFSEAFGQLKGVGEVEDRSLLSRLAQKVLS